MNQSITNTLTKDADKSVQIVQVKLNELKNVHRLASNSINLINDMEIKGAYCGPVSEILGWLTGIKTSVEQQIKTLEDTLPKQETPTIIEANVEEVKA
jgi:hypothetical protein